MNAKNSNAQSVSSSDLPIFCYAKTVHSSWPEFNKENEFSDGEGGGEALVKLTDVENLLKITLNVLPE